MIICGLDTETTGLDPEKDVITEIGAVLWDTELNAPVKFFSQLIKIDRPVPPEIVKLTGITDKLLEDHGEMKEKVWSEFRSFLLQAEFAMAHNAPFDNGFISKAIKDYSELNVQWIDSSTDVEFPESIATRKLTYLAAEHKLVNPFAHRALTDVLTMCQLVSRYDWNQTIRNAKTPTTSLRAMVTYDQNQKAKDLSYRWDGTKKIWVKHVKQNKLDQEIRRAKDAGFLAKVIGM